MGTAHQIPNPDYPQVPGAPPIIFRDHSFGATEGTVTLNGVALAIVSWGVDTIEATVPNTVSLTNGRFTGQLVVTRSNGISTELGVTLHVMASCLGSTPDNTVIRVPDDYMTIQEAIDAAPYQANTVGPLILVDSGTYTENVIMNKPVRLQGRGPGCTVIDGNPTPLERLDAWHRRIELPAAQGGLNGLALENFMMKYPFQENEAPCIVVFGEQFFPDGVIGAFGDNPYANVFNPGFRFGTQDNYADIANPVAGVAIPGQALIDGFKLVGSKAGGGLFVFTRARGLLASNLEVTNNQGNYAGGVSVSVPDAGFQMFDEDDYRQHTAGFQNTDVVLRYNKIHKNGGFQGAGGMAISEDSHNYRVEKNKIKGNFCRFNGAGFAHVGVSDDGMISQNEITFNENFFGAILLRAGDGGGIYIGGDLVGGSGSGSVTIDGNLIQGNLCGSGRGGGIRAVAMSGRDVLSINDPDIIPFPYPAPWPLYTLTIINNIIVDNIAALDGGGISLQDVSRCTIAHNTIANNDSTATGQAAFLAGSLDSAPMPAGISSHPHGTVLQDLWLQARDQPLLVGTGQENLEFFGIDEPTYSNPVLVDNIIWHNRSWWFDASYIDPLTGGLVGALMPNTASPYWDLGVEGSAAPADPHLDPAACVLTSQIDPATGHNYGAAPANLYADPQFVSEYFNTLETQRVIDEGGNNINIRFTPLTAAGSDYHIQPGSPAVDSADDAIDYIINLPAPAGAVSPPFPWLQSRLLLGWLRLAWGGWPALPPVGTSSLLDADFDREVRPDWMTGDPDVGADEIGLAAPVPDIKANGSDGPVTVVRPTRVVLTVTLDPGDFAGQNADWWIRARRGNQTFWVTGGGAVVAGSTPVLYRQAPLSNYGPVIALNRQLAAGIYKVDFIVDNTMDGVLNGATVADRLIVQVVNP